MDCSAEEVSPCFADCDIPKKADKLKSSTVTAPNCDPVAQCKSHNGNGHLNSKSAFKIFAARNLNEVHFTDILKIEENGINQEDFEAFAPNSATSCTKESTHNLQNIMDYISTPKDSKVDAIGRVDICRRIGSPRFMSNKGKLQEIYGYDIGNDTYLHAEEALYLLERGKLEIYCDHISLSVERARALFLHSKSMPENKSSNLQTCDIDEYCVFKYLAVLGMRVRRHNENSKNTNNTNIENAELVSTSGPSYTTDETMEVEGEELSAFQISPDRAGIENESNRGVKRKLCQTTDVSETGGSSGGVDDNSFSIDDEEMEANDSVFSPRGADNYTVVEVDSDEELDWSSPTKGGVVIEEIPEGFYVGTSSPCEEMPCSSKSARLNFEPQVFVDLPSSDSESDDEKAYMNQIWSKFVPGVSLQIGFPPSYLLPPTIGTRHEECRYNFTSHSSDVDLECFVDELDLNESPLEQNEKIYCNSWNEWREIMMQEATYVRNTSLLASSDFNLSNVAEKLNLWDDKPASEHKQHSSNKNDGHKFSIIYDIYSQSCRTVHKRRLAAHHSPTFHLAIVRSDEPIPNLKELRPLENDIPIVIAIVSDEHEIVFLTPESVPLTSLF